MWNWLFWALSKRFWVLTCCFGQSALSSTGFVYPSHRRQALLCCYYPTTEKSYENKNVLDSWQCFFNVCVCLSWKQIQVQNKIFFLDRAGELCIFICIIDKRNNGPLQPSHLNYDYETGMGCCTSRVKKSLNETKKNDLQPGLIKLVL